MAAFSVDAEFVVELDIELGLELFLLLFRVVFFPHQQCLIIYLLLLVNILTNYHKYIE